MTHVQHVAGQCLTRELTYTITPRGDVQCC
jgi:hypothetical protein